MSDEHLCYDEKAALSGDLSVSPHGLSEVCANTTSDLSKKISRGVHVVQWQFVECGVSMPELARLYLAII